MDRDLANMGDSELQEYLLDSGYTQHIFERFKQIFPQEEKPKQQLESYRFSIIDFSKNKNGN